MKTDPAASPGSSSGELLARWRATLNELVTFEPATPEWEEAAMVAADARWRYLQDVSGAKAALSAASRAAVIRLRLLRALVVAEIRTEKGSPEAIVLKERIRDQAVDVMAIADAAAIIGGDLPLSES